MSIPLSSMIGLGLRSTFVSYWEFNSVMSIKAMYLSAEWVEQSIHIGDHPDDKPASW